ncbi:MAG TPA: hypothetical protein VE954_35230 [Oligoflexus sp.]|uniref:hypothetical protein n=1 Tax=Oligoflexus sp. TaxID=1971216 RepID=UPI002D463019|nr:hypothetical protein [Oligoflexus sp.]HYX38386.1 hypothetical protein [Oligoflexus sp.]
MNIDHNGGVTSILLAGSTGSQAVQQLWAYKKALEPRFSLAWLAGKLGIHSRGNLSETLKGIRRWPRKYWKTLGPILELDELQSEMLAFLLERDEATTASDLNNLNREIETIRRFLQQRFFKFDHKRGLTLLASDVYCYFSMHARVIKEREIIDYFGKSRYADILRGMQVLLDNQLIEKTADGYRRNDSNAKFFSFHQNELDHSTAFLRESIQDAEEQVPRWIHNNKEACFGTTTMSVKREQFEKTLTQIKKDVFRYFSELETNEGDTIIRFNMQIYPVISEKH